MSELVEDYFIRIKNYYADLPKDLRKLDTEPSIGASTKFRLIWLSSFREEDF
jgi:hypothetical protein